MAILKLDLLPPRIKQARAKQLMVVSGVVAGVLILSMPVGLWYMKWSKVSSMKKELKQVEMAMVSPEFKDVLEQVAVLEADEAAVAKKLGVIDTLVGRQATWIKVLEALSTAQARAKSLWLTDVKSKVSTKKEDEGKVSLTIKVVAYSLASVDVFIDSMLSTSGLDMELDMEKLKFRYPAGAAGRLMLPPIELSFKFKKFKA